jgi:hypothetical protein
MGAAAALAVLTTAPLPIAFARLSLAVSGALAAGGLGWRWAFFLLFPGPLLGFAATRRIAR